MSESKSSNDELTSVVMEHLRNILSEVDQQITHLEEKINELERKHGDFETIQKVTKKGKINDETNFDHVEWNVAKEELKELYSKRNFFTKLLENEIYRQKLFAEIKKMAPSLHIYVNTSRRAIAAVRKHDALRSFLKKNGFFKI
jgi:hypothetical protein